MKRSLLWVAVILLLFAGSCVSSEEEINLLLNPGFESLDEDGLPENWSTDAYINRVGVTKFSVDVGMDSDTCVRIENFDMNDARFAQTVSVEPNSTYRLSGWIRADNVLDAGHGANLSIGGVYVFSDSIYETNGEWRYIETYGRTDSDQTEVTVFVRLGGYSGESQGLAFFDNVSLVKVDSLPNDATAEAWYTIKTVFPVKPANEEQSIPQPFWPWLILIALVYLVVSIWLMRVLQKDHHAHSLLEHKKYPRVSSSMPFFAILGLVLAALLRIITALTVEGYQVDVNCFTAWGNTMAKVGPAMFYQSNWCDYTPGYIYVMGLNGVLANLLGSIIKPAFIHKLVPISCDLLASWILYILAFNHGANRRQAGWLAVLFAFNPATFINSAAWCQIDSVLCFGLMMVAYFAIQKKWYLVFPMYVLCVLIKPQALMLGFLGLAAIIVELLRTSKHSSVSGGVTTVGESAVLQSQSFLQRIASLWKRFWAMRTKSIQSQMLLGVILSLVLTLIIVLPFCPNQESPFWLFEQYAGTLNSYNHATVNTANIFFLAGGNWAPITDQASLWVILFFLIFSVCWSAYSAFMQINKKSLWYVEPALMLVYAFVYLFLMINGSTWSTLGWATMSMAFVIVLPIFVRSGKLHTLPLCGGVLFLLLYVFGIKMHERYLFPAVFLLAMAYAVRRDWRVLLLLICSSCVLFINEGIILDNSLRLGSVQGHLNADNTILANVLSVINIVITLCGVWVCHHICTEDPPVRLAASYNHDNRETPNCNQTEMPEYKASAKLGLVRLDVILMLIVTVIYSIVTLTTLGSTKAPQRPWKSSAYDEYVYIDLGQHYDNFSMLYFCQVSYSNFAVAVADDIDGTAWSEEFPAQMAEGQCFQWKYLNPSYMSEGTPTFVSASEFSDVQKMSGRYVRINPKQVGLIINELIFKDEFGNIISGVSIVKRENANESSPLYSDPVFLLDEQNTLDGEPGWWNSTYFDEIYHARTGYELLHNSSVYEWTHPPLGKIIMGWFIGIFGMTPFGWRFAGALCGILMLPAIYLLAKQLFKRTEIAFIAMMLMALDCMHFTQTRIATIDSFPVLFIILSYFFMLRFMQRDLVLDRFSSLLPDLACSGFFMGCGVASKWIGVYAGLGLAALYFWTCFRHLRLGVAASRCIAVNHHTYTQDELSTLRRRADNAFIRIVMLCLSCLLFFVLVPVLIYLLSYADRFADREYASIIDLVKMIIQETESMLSYHGTPGLGMDHTFYSPWYEWPLMITPMYYASAAFKTEGMTYAIFCFGNPWVWVIGLGGIAYTVYRWCSGHIYRIADNDEILHLFRKDWDIAPGFILIGLLAQFLPWVLVPRGTYIYHYFASVPFLILGTCMLLHCITRNHPAVGKWLCIGYLILCLAWFVLLFPYASGLNTPEAWMDFIRDYPYISQLPDYWNSGLLIELNELLEAIPIFPRVYHH